MRFFLVALAIALPLIVALATGASTPILATGALIAVAAVVSPAHGLAAFLIVMPLVTRPVLPAPGFPIITAAAIILGWLLRLPVERPRLRLSAAGALLLLLVAFILAHFPTTLLTHEGDEARFVGSLMAKLVTGTLLVVGAALILPGRRPYPFLMAITLSALAAAALALLTLGSEAPPPMIAGFVDAASSTARPAGAFGDPNEFALFMATVAVTLLAVLPSIRSRGMRLVTIAAVVVLALAIAASASRTGSLALVTGTVVVGFVRSRRLGIGVLIACALVAMVAYPLIIEGRLTRSLGSADAVARQELASSDQGRLRLVLAGPTLFASSPVIGVGIGGYHLTIGDSSHNWYMTLLAEQGIIGITLWLLILVFTWSALRSRGLIPRSVGLGVLGAQMVGCAFLNPPYIDQSVAATAVILIAALVSDWGTSAVGSRTQAMTGSQLVHGSIQA